MYGQDPAKRAECAELHAERARQARDYGVKAQYCLARCISPILSHLPLKASQWLDLDLTLWFDPMAPLAGAFRVKQMLLIRL